MCVYLLGLVPRSRAVGLQEPKGGQLEFCWENSVPEPRQSTARHLWVALVVGITVLGICLRSPRAVTAGRVNLHSLRAVRAVIARNAEEVARVWQEICLSQAVTDVRVVSLCGTLVLFSDEPEKAMPWLARLDATRRASFARLAGRLCAEHKREREWALALGYARVARALDPTDSRGLDLLLEGLLANGLREEARLLLAQQQILPEAGPERAARLWLWRARLHQVEGDLDGATVACEHVRALQPDEVGGDVCLAQVAEAAGDYERAVVLWQRVVELSPSARSAYARLGAIFLDHLADPARAVGPLERYLELTSHREPPALTRLLSAYLGTGRYAEALSVARELAEIDPDDPTFDCQIGLAQLGLGNRKAALRALHDANSKRPDANACPSLARRLEYAQP